MANKVLLISYYYPPIGGIGSLRAQKFACYLPEYGWQSIVLAPERGCYFPDESLEDGSDKGVKIIRTLVIEPGAYLKRAVLNRRGAQIDQVRRHSEAPAERNFIVRRLKQVTRDWLYIPDGQAGWFPYAFRAGKRAIKQDGIDAIWSTSFPITSHLVACRLKLATGRPWIADFRDLWTENPSANYSSALRKRLDEVIEARLLDNADVIVTVSKSLAESLRRLTKGAKRVEVIMNGFDPQEFANIERTRPGKWTITFVGSYYSFYNPTPFLAALQRLIEMGAISRDNTCFRVVGEPHPDLRNLVSQFGLSDVTDFTDVAPHREALKYQVETTLLLFVLNCAEANTGIITGKLFEYLGARKPILGIVPPDFEAAQIIRETGAGVTLSATDSEGIERYLLASYSAFKAGVASDLSGQDLSRFERRVGAKQLAGLLAEITSDRQSLKSQSVLTGPVMAQ